MRRRSMNFHPCLSRSCVTESSWHWSRISERSAQRFPFPSASVRVLQRPTSPPRVCPPYFLQVHMDGEGTTDLPSPVVWCNETCHFQLHLKLFSPNFSFLCFAKVEWWRGYIKSKCQHQNNCMSDFYHVNKSVKDKVSEIKLLLIDWLIACFITGWRVERKTQFNTDTWVQTNCPPCYSS